MTAVTLVCCVVFSRVGPAASPTATLPLFIIGLLPLSCQHSARRPLPSGDCLVGRQGAAAAAATQLCCTTPLCHVACIALSSASTRRRCRRPFTHKSSRLTFKVSATRQPVRFNSGCQIVRPYLFYFIFKIKLLRVSGLVKALIHQQN